MTSTNFIDGVTNVAEGAALGSFIMPDPSSAHVWFDDFDSYAAGDWVITTTEAGAGNAGEALISADGGILVLTNDDADDDNDFLQWAGGAGAVIESFRFQAGKKLWFKARFKVSDATQSDIVMGLQITDTSPLAVTDGVYFLKADGSTSLQCLVTKNSTSSTLATAATLADDTYVAVGFYYDGEQSVQVFANDVRAGTLPVTNLPDDEDLTISFGIQNGSAGAKTMSIDYIFAAKQR